MTRVGKVGGKMFAAGIDIIISAITSSHMTLNGKCSVMPNLSHCHLTAADLVIIIHSQPMYGTLKSKMHLRKPLTLLCCIITTNEALEVIRSASKDQ